MAVITITATDLGSELISGVPQLLKLETNVPSTLFYTLDGSVPSTASLVYVDPINMPLDGFVVVRVLAVSGVDLGRLDITFKPDVSDIRLPRRNEATYGAGIVVDAYEQPNVLMDGYSLDEDGSATVPTRFSDYELEDLDIKFSRTGPNGEGTGTVLSIGFTPPPKDSVISHDASSPNNNNVFFNPRSLYITMDGRDGYSDQIHDGYRTINRPWGGTTNTLTYLGGRMLYDPSPYVTGGFVRTFYNAKSRLSVSYYFDHNETRWIKSIQEFDPSTYPAGVYGIKRGAGWPLVFKWIYNKRSSII